jgi:hypothetical protein
MRTKTLGILTAATILFAVSDVAMAQRFGRSAARGFPAASPQELRLVAVIRQQQWLHVRESWGEQDWQCFTWADLRNFKADNVPGAVVEVLKADPQFEQLVGQIRALGSSTRSYVLARALRTYKPTWAQLGRVTSAGQTDAGQQAEQEIARAVVDLVRQMLDRP